MSARAKISELYDDIALLSNIIEITAHNIKSIGIPFPALIPKYVRQIELYRYAVSLKTIELQNVLEAEIKRLKQ